FFQAEDGIRDYKVTGVQTCALPISGISRGHRQSGLHIELGFSFPLCQEVRVGGHINNCRMNLNLISSAEQQLMPEKLKKCALSRSEERRVGKECRYRE